MLLLSLPKDGWWKRWKIQTPLLSTSLGGKTEQRFFFYNSNLFLLISVFLPFHVTRLRSFLPHPPHLNLIHLLSSTLGTLYSNFLCIQYATRPSIWSNFFMFLWLFNNTLKILDTVISNHINFAIHKWKSILYASWAHQMQLTSLLKE